MASESSSVTETLTWRALTKTNFVAYPFRILAARMPDNSVRYNLYRGGVYIDKRGSLKDAKTLAEQHV